MVKSTATNQLTQRLAVVVDAQLGHCGLPCKDFSDMLAKDKQIRNGENVLNGLGKSGPPAHHMVKYLKHSATPFQFWENVHCLKISQDD